MINDPDDLIARMRERHHAKSHNGTNSDAKSQQQIQRILAGAIYCHLLKKLGGEISASIADLADMENYEIRFTATIPTNGNQTPENSVITATLIHNE